MSSIPWCEADGNLLFYVFGPPLTLEHPCRLALGIITVTQDKERALRPARLKSDQEFELTLTDPATLSIKLPPYSGRVLNEMLTAKRAIVCVDDTPHVEIIFDDETGFPYSIYATVDDFFEGKIPKENALKRLVVIHGQTPDEPMLDLPCSICQL